MMKRLLGVIASVLSLLALVGCADWGQRGQPTAARALQPPWDAAANPFVVPGWKSGDQASWQQQMAKRAQNQNEFLRVN